MGKEEGCREREREIERERRISNVGVYMLGYAVLGGGG